MEHLNRKILAFAYLVLRQESGLGLGKMLSNDRVTHVFRARVSKVFRRNRWIVSWT